jgi:hypothetical protein
MTTKILWQLLEDLFDYLDLEYATRIYLRSLAASLGVSLILVLLSKWYVRWYEKRYNIEPESKNVSGKKTTADKIVRCRGGILPAAFLAGIATVGSFIENVGLIGGAVVGTGVGLHKIHHWDKLNGLREFLKFTTPEVMYSYMEIEKAQKSARALEALQQIVLFVESCRRIRIFKYLLSQLSSSQATLASKKQAIDTTFNSKTFFKLVNDHRGLAGLVVCISTLIEYIYRTDRDLYFVILETLTNLVKDGKMKLIVLRAIVRLLRKAGIPIPPFLEEFIEEMEEKIENIKKLKPA